MVMFSLKKKIKADGHFLRNFVPAENKTAEESSNNIIPSRPDNNAKKIASGDPAVAEAALSWDDLIFRNRNREYGAYVLRTRYFRNVTTALGTSLFALALLIFGPMLYESFREEENTKQVAPKKLVYTELSAPPPIDKPKPPPPNVQLPRLQKVIKFVPPKVVKEVVVEQTPTIEEIKQNETAAVAVEGPAEVVFDEPIEEVIVEDDDEVFVVVEQNPEFKGGYDAMIAFIKQNMVYPPNARRMQIEGTVYVSFIVGKTGEISDVQVMRGIMKECDREAVRVVEMMPAWKPGTQNGRKVNVRFTLPIKFRMN